MTDQHKTTDARVERAMQALRDGFGVTDLGGMTWWGGHEAWWRDMVRLIVEAADAE